MISFNPKVNILVVKMPVAAHHQTALAFHDTLKLALQQMGLLGAIFSWGTTTFPATDGTVKQADMGWGPRRPTVVLEVGSSETSARFRGDFHF
jgi:hypothetical protein